jgi:superfamily I DNA/RNA helicase
LAISFKVDAAANLAERVRERVSPELANRLDSYTFHAFSMRLIRRFRPVLTGISRLDPDFTVGEQRVEGRQITFDDFVPLAIDILGNRHVLAAMRATYSHVFLDEFQDCTRSQYSLVKRAVLDTDVRLTAVGDTKQRIMGWAGALEGIFESFAEDFDAHGLNLYQNFRSAPTLRRMQNRMISVMDPAAAVAPNSIPGDAGDVEICSSNDAEEEAARVASWIEALIQAGTPESEIAILFDKQPELYSVQLREALDAVGIPYRNEQQLQDLVKEPLTQLLIAFLQVIAGDGASSAYVTLNRTRLFDLDNETALFRLRTSWNAHVGACRALVRQYDESLSSRRLLDQLATGFLDFFGPSAIAGLHPDYESIDRIHAVVSEVLDRVETLMSQPVDPPTALARFAEERGIRIMSIHKSKGLEFDAVTVVALEKQMFWGDPEDERAAFFVAISRAKHHLLLTHSRFRSRPSQAGRWEPHRTPHQEFLGYAMG